MMKKIGIFALALIVAALSYIVAAPAGAQYYGWPTKWNFSEGVHASYVSAPNVIAQTVSLSELQGGDVNASNVMAQNISFAWVPGAGVSSTREKISAMKVTLNFSSIEPGGQLTKIITRPSGIESGALCVVSPRTFIVAVGMIYECEVGSSVRVRAANVGGYAQTIGEVDFHLLIVNPPDL